MLPALCLSLFLADGAAAPLVAQLGARSFRVRERAHAQLARVAVLVLPQLRAARDRPPSEEVRHRLVLLTAPWWPEECLAATDRLRPGKRWPWLYLHGCYGGSGIGELVAEARTRGAPEAGPDYASYRLAAKLWTWGQLCGRRPVAAITADLAAMERAEADWKQQHAPPPMPGQ